MIYLWENTKEISEQILFSKPLIKNASYEDFIPIKEQHLLYLFSYRIISSNNTFQQFIQTNNILNCHIYKDM